MILVVGLKDIRVLGATARCRCGFCLVVHIFKAPVLGDPSVLTNQVAFMKAFIFNLVN